MEGGAFRTTEYVTKFELSRIIGMRILQVTQHNLISEEPRAYVVREILSGRNPVVIRRPLPDGTFEDRPLSGLKIDPDLRKLFLTCGNGSPD